MLKDKALIFETFMALVFAWSMVFIVPFRWSKLFFGEIGAVAPSPVASLSAQQRARSRAVARRVKFVAARLPWHSTCLVRALSGKLLLTRRGIWGSSVRFGVRINDKGGVDAHAWLVLGDDILLGANEADAFKALADLGRSL